MGLYPVERCVECGTYLVKKVCGVWYLIDLGSVWNTGVGVYLV